MKYACEPLRNFISDFNLTNPAGADCFEATVVFMVGNEPIKLLTEVHIVTSYPDGEGILYLLNRTINVNLLPTMFEANREQFDYLPLQNLRIQGQHHATGPYTVFIQPGNHLEPSDSPAT